MNRWLVCALALACLLVAPCTHARNVCGIGVGPALDSIPRNAAFLIETCGCTEEVLRGLGQQIPAHLISEDGDTVPMRLIRYQKADQEQALLGPGRYLRAGGKYRLHIPQLQSMPNLDWPDGLTWTASDRLTESMVGFREAPKIEYKMAAEANRVKIAVVGMNFAPLDSNEYYWVRVTVLDEWTGDQIQWLQAFGPGQTGLAIGYPLRHCGPAPILAFESEYKITLTLLGIDGAEGRSSDPIRIAPQ